MISQETSPTPSQEDGGAGPASKDWLNPETHAVGPLGQLPPPTTLMVTEATRRGLCVKPASPCHVMVATHTLELPVPSQDIFKDERPQEGRWRGHVWRGLRRGECSVPRPSSATL